MTNLLSNRYQILETLGKGGFGETFLAIDTQMPSARKCVIKQLKPCVQSDSIPNWLKERFKREAAVLEKLGENHPQIPCLYAHFSENNQFYLVQEWIEGETLTQIHQRRGNFSEREVRELLINILPILNYIHTNRIIHRDIKPDNIIIRASDGQPVLIDFGIVKEAVATVMNGNGKTAYSIALGTPGYMSSEQAAGRPIYASDLYSLGLTAVFLLTGKTPQYLETDLQTGEILWPKEIPDLNSDLANIISRTLRFHPKDRFPTAKKMLAALKSFSPTVTAPTIAVISNAPSLKTPSAPTKTSLNSESETPWALLSLGSFLIVSAIFGALTLGFMLATKERSRPSPSPSPSEIIESPTPPVKTPSRPNIKRRSSPEPEVSPSPEPEVSPSPEPEVSPSPEPEVSPSPEPEVSPSPEPEVSPSPEPEVSPVDELPPIPEPTTIIPIPIQPPPNPTTSPQPSSSNREAKPQPSALPIETTPQPNQTPVKPNSTPTAPDIIIDTEPP